MLTKNNRIVDQFIVSDAETRAAIPEERWSDVKEKIFAKLKRRNVLNTASGDPTLVEHVRLPHDFLFRCDAEMLHFSNELPCVS